MWILKFDEAPPAEIESSQMKELLMKRARRETGAEEIPPNVIAEFHRAAEPDVRLPPSWYGLAQYWARESPPRFGIPEVKCHARAFGERAEPLHFLDLAGVCRMKEIDSFTIGLLLQLLHA